MQRCELAELVHSWALLRFASCAAQFGSLVVEPPELRMVSA